MTIQELKNEAVKSEIKVSDLLRKAKLILKDYPIKFWTGSPAISFKTRKGVSYGTGLKKEKCDTLPYWVDSRAN